MTKSTASLLFRAAILLLLLNFEIQCRFANAQCLDSEALFQVSYKPVGGGGGVGGGDGDGTRASSSSPKNEDHDGDDDIVLELYVIPVLAARNDTVQRVYSWDEPFTFEMCIAKENACGQFAILGPPSADKYEISWDGQVLAMAEAGPTLQFDTMESSTTTTSSSSKGYLTAMEFGSGCVPECESDEAIFENQYRTSAKYKISIEPYRVEDQNGNAIIVHNEQFTYDTFLYIERYCLPINDCYRFIMGDRIAISEGVDEVEHVSISFDGETLFESKAWYYESFDFGGGCPGTGSRFCDSAQESMLEFFLTARMPSDPTWPTLSWEVTMHSNTRSPDGGDGDTATDPEIIHHGSQSSDIGVTLHYDFICVPKGSCVTFSIVAKENDRTTYISADYELSMDKTIYRKQRFNSLLSPNVDTAYLGECAEIMSSVCDPASESLLDLNFQTISSAESDPTSSSNHFPYYTSYWYVSESDDMSAWILKSSEFIDDFEYDSSYRVLQCIPKENCLHSLFVHQNADFEDYSVRLNGASSTLGPMIVDEDDWNLSNYEVTVLDDVCGNKSSLSGGQIAGITVATLLIGGALIAGAVFGIRRRRSALQRLCY